MTTKIKSADRDMFAFSQRTGFVTFSNRFISYTDKAALAQEIDNNYFLQKTSAGIKGKATRRLQKLQTKSAMLVKLIEQKYSKEVASLAVGGSFTYKDCPNDLDLNVVLKGKGIFDYYEEDDLDLGFDIEKVSIMVFTMDDILSTEAEIKTNDTIKGKDFLHQDLIAREMLIAPLRNITFYGYPMIGKGLFLRDMLVRLVRQLYFADKTLKGEISKYALTEMRTQKALSRISEAELILGWLIEKMGDVQ